MVEIYSYDITTHERFARDQKEVEAFRKQYHIPPSASGVIAAQSRILDFVPKHPAIVTLMQTYQRKMWAGFMIPQNFYLQRFASSYVAPSLGSNEKQKADVQKLKLFIQRKKGTKPSEKEGREKRGMDEELEREGEALVGLLEKGIIETNEMVDFVIARMHQFVQA